MFEGLSKKIGLRLLEIENAHEGDPLALKLDDLYELERDAMNRVMFKDSFYVLRFVEILTECIKKTHPTLPYILRNQYRNANCLFLSAKEAKNAVAHLSSLEHFVPFYRDVLKHIMSPLLKRHGLYSPNVLYMMVIDLYMFMLSDYLGYEMRDRAREFIKGYAANQTPEDIDGIVWICGPMKQMMKDELYVWQSMKMAHSRKNKNPRA